MSKYKEPRDEIAGVRFEIARNIFGFSYESLIQNPRWEKIVNYYEIKLIRKWKNEGMPVKKIAPVAYFFGINGYYFSDPHEERTFQKKLYEIKNYILNNNGHYPTESLNMPLSQIQPIAEDIVESLYQKLNQRYVMESCVLVEKNIYVDIYWHDSGLTHKDAIGLKQKLENYYLCNVYKHRNPEPPDSIFIGALIGASEAGFIIPLIPYDIKYIFKPDYCEFQGGDSSGLKIGLGYISSHNEKYRDKKSEPVKITSKELQYLTEPKISNTEFQKRLAHITLKNQEK